MMVYLLGILVVVALIVSIPLALIWALNTIFGLAIVYTLKTWLAMAFIATFLGAIGSSNDTST